MSILLNISYDVIVPLFIVIGLALVIGRRFNPNLHPLSTLILQLFSPALILDGLVNSDLKAEELWQLTAIAAGVSLCMWLIGVFLARALRLERKLKSTFLLTVIVMNCGNFGIPLTLLAYGKPGEQRAIVYTVAMAVIINTLGVYIASSGTTSPREALTNVFKLPLVYAAIIGLVINLTGSNILNEGGLLEPLGKSIGVFAAAAVPAQLALLGLQIAHISVKSLKEQTLPVALAVGMRLVVAPVLAGLLAALMGLDGLVRQIGIVESSMPSGVFSVTLATEFEGEAQFASTVILVSTLASIVTLSILLVLVR